MGVSNRILLELVERQDSSSIPNVCFGTCNNAYIEAQKVGESAALCAPDSAFFVTYQTCTACVEANGDSTKVIGSTLTQFALFISFCAAQSSSLNPTQASSLSSQLSAAKSSIETAASSLDAAALSVGVTLGTTVLITSTLISIETVTQPQSYQANLTSSGLAISPTPSFSPPITESTSANHAWIAGAVIEPVSLIVFGILAFLVWGRRKYRSMAVDNTLQPDEKKKNMIKSQLHADSLHRHELEGHATTELGNERVLELPALEPVGTELSAKKDASPIKRKPVGSPRTLSSLSNG